MASSSRTFLPSRQSIQTRRQPHRPRLFDFYVGINVGFLLAVDLRLAGETYGYHWATAPRRRHVGRPRLLSLRVAFLAARPRRRLKGQPKIKQPLSKANWKSVIALFLCYSRSLFWRSTNSKATPSAYSPKISPTAADPGLIDWQIPVTWFQAFNPAFIVLFTPLLVFLWGWQAKRKTEPSVLTKMALAISCCGVLYRDGCSGVLLGHGRLAGCGFCCSSPHHRGELYFSPIGLALTARVSPPQIMSMMMGYG